MKLRNRDCPLLQILETKQGDRIPAHQESVPCVEICKIVEFLKVHKSLEG